MLAPTNLGIETGRSSFVDKKIVNWIELPDRPAQYVNDVPGKCKRLSQVLLAAGNPLFSSKKMVSLITSYHTT